MGDEPVLCPFCDKPLPPALFERHMHPPRPKQAAPPLARSQTINGTMPPNRFAALAQSEIAQAEPPKIPAPQAATPSKAPSPMAATPKPIEEDMPVNKADADPAVTSETLGPVLNRADSTNHHAAESTIHEDDLKRWARLAGIAAPAAARPSAPETDKSDAKPFPLLAPPPPPAATVAKASGSRPSSRFGFFGRQAKADEESDEEGGVASGYAKLGQGGDEADSDEDADEPRREVHDEPEELQEPERSEAKTVDNRLSVDARTTTSSPTPVTPVTPANEDLRTVLKEVLDKVNGLVRPYNLRDNADTCRPSRTPICSTRSLPCSPRSRLPVPTSPWQRPIRKCSRRSSSLRRPPRPYKAAVKTRASPRVPPHLSTPPSRV